MEVLPPVGSGPGTHQNDFFSFENLVNGKRKGLVTNSLVKKPYSQLPPIPSLPRHSFSTNNDFDGGNGGKNNQLCVNNSIDPIRRLSAL
uniref:Uncharacterized protein n=1 Tax=Ditylenchus dipsaci TaxID=166011 RepID=A0A915EPG4_9BILA